MIFVRRHLTECSEINAMNIIAGKDVTYAVTKRKPERIQVCWDSNP